MGTKDIDPADMGLTKHSDYLSEEAHKDKLGKPAHKDGDKPTKPELENGEGPINDQRNGDDDPETLIQDGGDSAFDSVTANDLGPVFTEYKNDPEGAIERLLKEQSGDARSVWSREGIGDIDLIWGGDRFGLKKIAQKHPEALAKLPGLLKRGRIIKASGGSKVFLVDDKEPLHITVIGLDYFGAAKAWIVTSYDDQKGRASGILASVDTKKLDSAEVGCRSLDPMLEKILGGEVEMVNVFDNAAPMGALERLKLIRELGGNKKQIDGLGEGPLAAMQRLKLTKRSNEIRTQLGAGVIQAPANRAIIEPTQPEVTTVEETVDHPAVAKLRDVAAGKHDGEGLSGMFGLIQEACSTLNDAELLTGDAEAVANAAITHWAEVEERENG